MRIMLTSKSDRAIIRDARSSPSSRHSGGTPSPRPSVNKRRYQETLIENLSNVAEAAVAVLEEMVRESDGQWSFTGHPGLLVELQKLLRKAGYSE